MTLFVCTMCCEEECEMAGWNTQEARGCTLNKPKTRDVYPVYCSPDQYGRIRVPVWREVPEKKQSKIL